jgi:hypothetical protein
LRQQRTIKHPKLQDQWDVLYKIQPTKFDDWRQKSIP